jgi:amino acid transporter
MPESQSRKKFTLSKKTPEERGITFSQRESPGHGAEPETTPEARSLAPKHKVLLQELQATSICGNDITSSCLYVAAISATYAGALAPLALLMVSAVLFLYRKIYSEVGDALPLNGGAYNCLLNTTTKARASVAACMTVLSYIATAVISAKTSVEYVHALFGHVPVIAGTIFILVLFAGLTIIGIGESAKAATGIFIFHIVTLTTLVVAGGVYVITNPSIFLANWEITRGANVGEALFLGFSVALLGVSGFESSSNFIEEQAPGVFPKTLRNMWLAVTVFNPLIAAIALGVLPLQKMVESKDFLLIDVADSLAGRIAAGVIAVDAALVLSGAVLASFIGVTGLVTRMTLDRCLPQNLLKTNKRGTNHRIVLLFLVLCISIVMVTGGDLLILAGVYTISFLSVMCLFAVGNILLKVKRAKLPRRFRASWLTLFIAIFATVSGIVGNLVVNPQNFRYFSAYFFPAVAVVLVTLYRHQILSFVLLVINDTMKSLEMAHRHVRERITAKMNQLDEFGVIFFSKGDDVASLNKAMLYVLNNEITRRVIVVHVLDGTEQPPPRLVSDLKLLDEIYPELRIELLIKHGKFGPRLITELSSETGIAPNYMFVGTPGDHFPHRIADLGGVRVII